MTKYEITYAEDGCAWGRSDTITASSPEAAFAYGMEEAEADVRGDPDAYRTDGRALRIVVWVHAEEYGPLDIETVLDAYATGITYDDGFEVWEVYKPDDATVAVLGMALPQCEITYHHTIVRIAPRRLGGNVCVEIETDEDAAMASQLTREGYRTALACPGHDWRPDKLDGCQENPGVWSHAGNTVSTRRYCLRCGVSHERYEFGYGETHDYYDMADMDHLEALRRQYDYEPKEGDRE